MVDALSRMVHAMHAITISTCKSDLKIRILEAGNSYQQYMQIKRSLQQGEMQPKYKDYEMKEDGFILYKCRIYVLNSQGLKNLVLSEMHRVPYVGHLGCQKTISTIREQYFWLHMKKIVVDYIAWFLECQKVKNKHKNPIGLI